MTWYATSYFPDVSDKEWYAKIEAALDAVALNPGDVLGKYPHQLSGGQQQRLLIARALLLDVKVLIADEIISMLDASTRVDVLNLLVKLKRQGLAILFITHDLSLGNYVSDRTIILRHGAIVEMGATREDLRQPAARLHQDAADRGARAAQEVAAQAARPGPGLPSTVRRRPGQPRTARGHGARHASLLDELTHAEQVVKRDLRAVFGGGAGRRQAASPRWRWPSSRLPCTSSNPTTWWRRVTGVNVPRYRGRAGRRAHPRPRPRGGSRWFALGRGIRYTTSARSGRPGLGATMGYRVIGSPTDSGSVSLGSSPGTPASSWHGWPNVASVPRLLSAPSSTFLAIPGGSVC